DDIASRLGVSSEQVIEAQELGRAYTTYSLDADASATDHHAKPTSLAERIGIADGDMASFENIASLKRACEVLDPTERLVVYLRFYEEVPQTEIARRLGVSQMNISRVQRRAIKKIRASLFDEADVVTRGAVS
ncbi:MAG: sigma-70 family RNA polymerase sigma factor, partial [Candidatus Eremiobacteraeota bacterium]|nr:sigma-70 family RNA polymerase sigma factor [Candidatus Eremiobacteraeota bacterium]